jgi:hypothetical protein
MRSILTLVVAVAAALPACNLVEPEGRQQATTFTTFLTRQETRARAESWLGERALYQVTSSEPAFVRGEKRRARSVGAGEQVDVQSVRMETVSEGTRVELQSQTFLLRGSVREQADQLSPEAGTDHVALVQFLMPRPF